MIGVCWGGFMSKIESYLQPTELCDFDTDSQVRARAMELAQGCAGDWQKFDRIYGFVKALPYGLEDWDVRASETLRKGWGMCCGKTNLLVAMSRVLMIPARYKVFRIRAESRLLQWVAEQEGELLTQLGGLPLEQDHLECEVCLDGAWRNYDPSRDPAMEAGLERLGIPLDREPVADADGVVRFVRLASIDEWARERQQVRRFREGRQALFARVNRQLGRIRQIGSQGVA